MNVPMVERQKDLLKRFLQKIGPGHDFIEIGCGEGHMTKLLSDAGNKGLAIDISEFAISRASKKSIPDVKFRNIDVMDIKKGNHDLAVLLFVLEHIKDDRAALKKISSIMKKGGSFIVSVPAHKRSYSNQDRLCGHYRRYDRKHIVSLLKRSGFKIQKIWSFGFPISNLYTWFYNLILKIRGVGNRIIVENTKISGTTSKKYFPGFIKKISWFVFPVLTFLVKIDSLFLETDLGTHYIILCRKK